MNYKLDNYYKPYIRKICDKNNIFQKYENTVPEYYVSAFFIKTRMLTDAFSINTNTA